jgi:hypothetical protein
MTKIQNLKRLEHWILGFGIYLFFNISKNSLNQRGLTHMIYTRNRAVSGNTNMNQSITIIAMDRNIRAVVLM